MTTTFDQLGLPDALVGTLTREGITEPFPIQEATISDAIGGRDVAGRAPTGSGKTLAFGLPMLAKVRQAKPNRPTALILAPTRELASQIRRDLAPYGKAMHRQVFAIFGGVRYNAQRDWLRRGVDVLVATPGRLEDLIEQGDVNLRDVSIVAIDEADRMADMGFLPSVRRILNSTAKDRQTLLFSATLDGDVAVLIREYQTDPVRHETGDTEPEAIDADHHFWLVQQRDKIQHTADVVETANRSIVFTRTRHGADRLAKQLANLGVGAVAMHGGRSQNQRNRALQSFASGDAQALVATDVAARGIHIDAVASVIHYDPPADHKDYVHRSGRTARAGASGTVVSLVTSDQRRAVRRIQTELDLHEPIEKPRIGNLKVDVYPTSTKSAKRSKPSNVSEDHRKSAPRNSRPRNDGPRNDKSGNDKPRDDGPRNDRSRNNGTKTSHQAPTPRPMKKHKPAQDGVASIYVANIPWGTTDDDIRALFGPYGQVHQATVMIDRRGRSKGFAFVDMPDQAAHTAINALNGSPLDGRDLTVRFSRPEG